MLQVILGEHPQVATTVELTVFRRYAAPWIETWEEEKSNSEEGRWDQGLPFVWDRPKLIGFLQQFVDGVYEQLLASKLGATHVLDKHPGNALYTKLIREFLPEARFIHVIRDGRDVACSMMSAAKKIGFGTKEVGDSAEVWKRQVFGAREAAQVPERYLEVRYEDLLSQGVPAYRRVLDFCELKCEPGWIEAILEANTFEKMKEARRTGDPGVQAKQAHYRKGRAGSWLEDLSSAEAFEFEQHAGDLLRELGYETSLNWWQRSPLDPIIVPAVSRLKRIRLR
jgi:Sulfotransferase family